MRNRRTKGRISTKRSSDKNTNKNVNDDDPPPPPSGWPPPPPPPPTRPLPQSPPPMTMIVVLMLMVMLLMMVRIIGWRRRQRLTCADEDKEGSYHDPNLSNSCSPKGSESKIGAKARRTAFCQGITFYAGRETEKPKSSFAKFMSLCAARAEFQGSRSSGV